MSAYLDNWRKSVATSGPAGEARIDPAAESRRRIMALCAEATRPELDGALAALAPLPPVRDLRRPESGMVMLRGRAGGDGALFNLGEATVTRAAVALMGDQPATGFAYQLGRDPAKARLSATLDALWQVAARRDAVEEALGPIEGRIGQDEAQAARRAAATRVNFFTLVRGED